jgi:hypothetical protein
MLHTLGRGLAPAATAALLLLADGLLTESGRPLAAQNGATLARDITIAADDLPLTTEAGAPLLTENDQTLFAQAPLTIAAENGGDLITETDQIIVTEQI